MMKNVYKALPLVLAVSIGAAEAAFTPKTYVHPSSSKDGRCHI